MASLDILDTSGFGLAHCVNPEPSIEGQLCWLRSPPAQPESRDQHRKRRRLSEKTLDSRIDAEQLNPRSGRNRAQAHQPTFLQRRYSLPHENDRKYRNKGGAVPEELRYREALAVQEQYPRQYGKRENRSSGSGLRRSVRRAW